MGRGAPLGVGVIGAGFIGAVHARSALLAGGRVTGVAASSPRSSEAAAARLGAERAFESPEALVESPDVDVVHVCTPNHLHVPLALAALQAGKHVICEKPLALDEAGASRLVDAAAESGRQAAVPFVYRYYPMAREARARVLGGTSGSLRLLHGTYLQDWLSLPADDNWRVDADLGGASRAFADIGSHWCDLAEFISGDRITRVSARLATVLPERSLAEGRPAFDRGDANGPTRAVHTEDAAIVQFETATGALGSVVVSQVSPGREEPALDRARRVRGGARVRPGASRVALARTQGRRRDHGARPRGARSGRRAPLDPAARSPAGLRGLLRRLRRRRLRGDPRRGRARGHAPVRRRAARRADHGGGAGIRRRRVLVGRRPPTSRPGPAR